MENPTIAEVLISHACEQEDEAVKVGRSGIVAVAEISNVGMATVQSLQVGIEDVDARRREVAFNGRITCAAHVVGSESMGEGCDVEVIE